MYAARAAKPKLSLSISAAQNARSSFPLKSPSAAPRTPISPAAPIPSPGAGAGAKRFSTLQPSYAYANTCSSKSILKKQPGHGAGADKRIKFKGTPTVHCVTPIENKEEYYGCHTRMGREERRWVVRE